MSNQEVDAESVQSYELLITFVEGLKYYCLCLEATLSRMPSLNMLYRIHLVKDRMRYHRCGVGILQSDGVS